MNIRKFIVSAITGSILWTLFLTPYMFLVVKNTIEQYISWIGMQFILVPIIAPVVFQITEFVQKKVEGWGEKAKKEAVGCCVGGGGKTMSELEEIVKRDISLDVLSPDEKCTWIIQVDENKEMFPDFVFFATGKDIWLSGAGYIADGEVSEYFLFSPEQEKMLAKVLSGKYHF